MNNVSSPAPNTRPPTPEYVELRCRSAFSFLAGASLPEDLIARAAAHGYGALALADRDGVYGAPRFHLAAQRAGLRALIGAELTFQFNAKPLSRLQKNVSETLRQAQGERKRLMKLRRDSAHAEPVEASGGVFQPPARCVPKAMPKDQIARALPCQ